MALVGVIADPHNAGSVACVDLEDVTRGRRSVLFAQLCGLHAPVAPKRPSFG